MLGAAGFQARPLTARVLHPRLLSTIDWQAGLERSWRSSREDCRHAHMCEPTTGLSEVDLAGEKCVVKGPSGLGGFMREETHPSTGEGQRSFQQLMRQNHVDILAAKKFATCAIRKPQPRKKITAEVSRASMSASSRVAGAIQRLHRTAAPEPSSLVPKRT